jgi:multidrug efflux system outer membrane protein
MRFLPFALAILAAGCTVGPDYRAPDPVLPPAWSAEAAPAGEAGAIWWRGFGDPVLEELVQRGLEENTDIGIALARLDEANALVDVQKAGLAPALDAGASGDASTVLDGDGNDNSRATASLAFGFVPDIFGGQRRRIEQAEATREARRLDVADVQRLAAASIAERYIQLRRSRARLDLLTTSLELQQQTLDIVRQRADAGLSADLDVQRAASDLARTRAQRGNLDIAEARAAHDLAILTGQVPAGTDIVPPDGTDIPVFAGGPPAGIPADLVRARPDLRAAERELAAASAAIGVATADLYPAFDIPGRLTADIGSADAIIGDVVAQIGAALSVPLLDGGRRDAGIRAAEARARQARLAYERTLLEALGEVETALVSLAAIEARTGELGRAVAASQQAFGQLDALYREGLASFIDILDAQRTLISSRESQVDSQADYALAVIDLYRALGAPVSE